MGVWKVTFEGSRKGVADDFTLKFNDIIDLDLYFLRKTIRQLLDAVAENEHYSIIGNIKRVIGPDKDDYSDKTIYAILGTNNQGIKYGLLLAVMKAPEEEEEEEDEYRSYIIGVWPKHFYGAVSKDNDFLEDIVAALVDLPETWDDVNVILPIDMDLDDFLDDILD